MAGIRWEHVTKDFGTVVAVNDLNLECKDGEFLCLLGPSGCGKTTTLRMTAGLEKPTSGTIYFDDKPINHLSPRERNIAMVFENYALYPHMKVYDNIAYPLRLAKLPKDEIDRKVRRVASLLEIEELLDRLPRQISGGQKQRVGIARALVREPTAFVMDEPLSHLDAKLRAYMRAELKRLQKELGITTVFVTHDQLEAMTMADRVAVMNFGILQQYGSPRELYEQPANVFVAKFIGEPPMNLIPCEAKEIDGTMHLIREGMDVILPDAWRQRVAQQATSNQLLLGARPQHMLIHREGEVQANGRRNIMPGFVYITEPLGTELLVRVRVGEELVHVLCPEDLYFGLDEKVYLEVPADKMFLFDAKTEKRIG